MAFLQIEDISSAAESIVFPKLYEEYRSFLVPGKAVLLHGRVSLNDDSSVSIIASAFENVPDSAMISDSSVNNKPSKQSQKKKAGKKGLFLRFDTSDSPQIKICKNLLSIFEGSEPVYFYYSDTKKYVNAGKCDCNVVLLKELQKILGKDNAIFNQ